RPVACQLLEERDERVVELPANSGRMRFRRGLSSECKAEHCSIAEKSCDAVLRVALADAELLLQHLPHRPVRSMAIRQAPSRAQAGSRLLIGEPLPELTHKPRLPDARIAEDRHEMRQLELDRPAIRRLQQ